MNDLFKKFSRAAKVVSSNNNPIRQRIYSAFFDYLSDINTDDLPGKIQPIYDALAEKLLSTEPFGDIGEDEARNLAKDILHITDVLRDQRKLP